MNIEDELELIILSKVRIDKLLKYILYIAMANKIAQS